MSTAIEILGGALLITGAFFVLIGATGLLRLPDILTRIHGASITDTLGAGAILLGLAMTAGWSLLTGKLLALLILMALLNPSASHALARAAVHGIRKPWLEKEES